MTRRGFVEERPRGDAKDVCDPYDRRNGSDLATLESLERLNLDLEAVGQLLLRPVACLPFLRDASADALLNARSPLLWHEQLQTIDLTE